MAMFEQVATLQLQVLFCVLLLGNPLRPFPASAAKACGADLYVRVALTHHFLVLAAFTAAGLILHVQMWVRIAQAAAARAKAFDDADHDHEAGHEGIGSVAARWSRRRLRGTLLLAVALSFAAAVLAVVASEDAFRYRAGCTDPAYDSPLGLLMIGVFALVHGFFAWVAVSQN